MTKIESFKTFSQLQSQLREEVRQKEVASKREASVAAFNELLSKYNASSIADVNEEEMEAFMSELTAEGNAFGDAVRKAKEAGEDEFEFDGKTYKVTEDEDEEVEEGNAFGDAVRKAKEAGEEEFEFDGKTYKVTEEESILESNKRQVAAVVKSFSTYSAKMPVFKMMNDESLLWFIRETVKEALVCANFHTEANMVPKYIKPAKLGSIEIKPAELGGNIYMKVPKKVIMDLVQVISSNVCAAAKYDGYAIIEGAAGYLDTIRPGKKSAEGLRAALAALQA